MDQNQLLKELFGAEPTLIPEDMYTKKFRTRLAGGYRPKEVDEYLRRAADLMESLLKRIEKLRQEAQAQERVIAEYRQHEQSLREALVSAQQFASDALETARSKADAMVTEARLHKERVLLEAEQLPEMLQDEVRGLREQRDRLRAELTGILDVHTSLLRGRPVVGPENCHREAPASGPQQSKDQEADTCEEDVQE